MPIERYRVASRLPSASGGGARHLVFVRAGADSLHPGWIRDEPDRGWDLFASYYGEAPASLLPCEFFCAGGRSKFEHFLTLYREDPQFFLGYDYVWMPDPDLTLIPGSVSALFRVAHELGVALAQPSLDPRSYSTYRLMLRNPDYAFRQTDYVEVMCPLFSRDALRACVDTFDRSISTWGLDLLWYRRMAPGARVGIIDSVCVHHTKRIDSREGAWYRKLRSEGIDASAELRSIMDELGMADVRPRYFPRASIPAASSSALGALLATRLRGARHRIKVGYWAIAGWIERMRARGSGS
jgi:hypothetical protein